MKITFSPEDEKFMSLALRLSERGKGYVEPNPLVGAVVVKSGRVLASGYHACFGGDHAERVALERIAQPDTTLYVTLEPCCHFGKTPPCTDLLIAKRVKRVVVALQDPNPLVNGNGLRILKANGIQVSLGILKEMAANVNRHYLTFFSKKRPYVAVHAGISLDGKLTDRAGQSRWITSRELRAISHSLRGEFSAIMAGRGTVETDNPLLTLRDPGWKGKKLYRIVLDSENRLPSRLRVFQERDRFPLIVFSSLDAKNKKKKTDCHFFVKSMKGQLSLPVILTKLRELGISSLLVEGGGALIGSFLSSGLVDEVYLFVAPRIVGGRMSTELFPEGVKKLASSIGLEKWRIYSLSSGYIFQGVKQCSPAS